MVIWHSDVVSVTLRVSFPPQPRVLITPFSVSGNLAVRGKESGVIQENIFSLENKRFLRSSHNTAIHSSG